MFRKNAVFRLLLVFVGICLFSYTAYLITKNFDSLKQLSLEHPFLLLINFLIIVPINIYATGRLFDVALRNVLKVNIGRIESFGLASLARLGNYVSFGQVGFVIRVLYLKKIHAIKTSDSVINLGAGNLVFYIFSILLAFTLIYLNNLDFAGDPIKNSLGFLIFIGALIAVVLRSNIIFNSKFLGSYSLSFKKLLRSRRTLLDFLLWSVVMTITFTAMLIIEFAVLGGKINIIDALFITSIANLASIINITPAGIGVSEGLLLLAGGAIGISPELLIASAILRRSVILIFITISSLFFSKKLFNKTLFEFLSSARKHV